MGASCAYAWRVYCSILAENSGKRGKTGKTAKKWDCARKQENKGLGKRGKRLYQWIFTGAKNISGKKAGKAIAL